MKNLLICLFASSAIAFSNIAAQGKIELQDSDTMRSVLQKHVGRPVDLRLKSGEKIGGKLEKVTPKLGHLSRPSGAEYFDGVIDVNGIAAAAVRSKAQ